MTQPPLWTRDFITVFALNFLVVLVFYLLLVVVGLYATQELGASASEAGLVAGVFIIGVLLGRLLIGQYIDRLGRKRCLLAGLGIALGSCLLYFAQGSMGVLIATRLLHGVGTGIAATTIATAVAHLIPLSRSGEGIGYYSMSSSLATAIGPFIGIFMTQHTDFRMILTLCSLLSILCLVVAFYLRVPEMAGADNPAPLGFSLRRIVEPSVLPFCTLVFVLAVYYSSVLSFLNLYAAELELHQAASFFFVVYAVTLLVSRPFIGRLMDARGANLVMYPALLLMALGMATLGLTSSGSHLLLAALLLGLGFGNLQSTAQAIVIKSVTTNRLALATTTFYLLVDSGLGFGPYLLGLVIPHTGFGNLYVLLGALTLLTLPAYHLVHGRKAAVSP